MYTSFCANTTGGMSTRSRRGKNQLSEPPTCEEFKEQGKFERQTALHLNQRLMNNKIVVSKVTTTLPCLGTTISIPLTRCIVAGQACHQCVHFHRVP
jgi:hypothetical protein